MPSQEKQLVLDVKQIIKKHFDEHCKWNCTIHKAAEEIAQLAEPKVYNADLVIVYEDDMGVHVVKPNNGWLVKDFVSDLMMRGVDNINITCVEDLEL